jgi:hypothetical protein
MVSRCKVLILVLGMALAVVAGCALAATTAKNSFGTLASAVWGS